MRDVKRYEAVTRSPPHSRERKRMRPRERKGRNVTPSKEERSGIQQRIPEFHAASRDRSTPAHARTNVRGRVPNNRLPLSLGMLRTATGLQIVLTLRVLRFHPVALSPPRKPLSRNFPGVPYPRSAHRHTERACRYPAFTYSRRIHILASAFVRASHESVTDQLFARDSRRSFTDYVRERHSTANPPFH